MLYNYSSSTDLNSNISKFIPATEVVLDIGTGILPINFFRPKLHIMIEPWREYADIIAYRNKCDKSIIILNGTAQEILTFIMPKSIDSIFLVDVIEHMDKTDGLMILRKCELIARNQICVFTPLGFLPQHEEYKPYETDAWGLSGVDLQRHRSGWFPEDFGDFWDFHVCKEYHQEDNKGKPWEIPKGAFWAIRNLPQEDINPPRIMADIRRPVPEEQKLIEFQELLAILDRDLAELRNLLAARDGDLAELRNLLATRDGDLAELRNQLATRDGDLAELHNQLAARDGDLAELRNLLATRDGDLRNLREIVRSLEEKCFNLENIANHPIVRFLRLVNQKFRIRSFLTIFNK